MEYIPVQTRVLQPPHDDLLAAMAESLPVLREGDIVVITSKVVSLHEGRCVPISQTEKSSLVRAESDVLIPRDYWGTPLTITRHAFIGSGGVDESNGDGYYVLLPEDSFASAQRYQEWLREHCGCQNIGVIITDSMSTPLRVGAVGVAIGWWGFVPLLDHRGRRDLFGRTIQIERSNLVDGIAAGATVLSGEVDECIPIVIARGVPGVTFSEGSTRDQIFAPYSEDIFRVLYERFLPPA